MNLQGTADRRRSFINTITINEKADSGEHGKIHYAKMFRISDDAVSPVTVMIVTVTVTVSDEEASSPNVPGRKQEKCI